VIFSPVLNMLDAKTDEENDHHDVIEEDSVLFDLHYDLAIQSPKIDFSDVFHHDIIPTGQNQTSQVAQTSRKKISHEELANEREKKYCCPAEDKPGIYLLCSAYSIDWYEKCEVVNEFLTSAFLDRTNGSLREWQCRLLDDGILTIRDDEFFEIVKGGREPSEYFCNKKTLQRNNQKLPISVIWPCHKCNEMEECFHELLLPFRYGMPRGPHQANDFDCGNFTVYFIRRWFDSDRPDLSEDSTKLKRWFSLRDIFNFKYDCRRYLDKLVGLEDREPVNKEGNPEENGYLEDFDSALASWERKKAKKKDESVDLHRDSYKKPKSKLTQKKISQASSKADQDADSTQVVTEEPATVMIIYRPKNSLKLPPLISQNSCDTTPEVSPFSCESQYICNNQHEEDLFITIPGKDKNLDVSERGTTEKFSIKSRKTVSSDKSLKNDKISTKVINCNDFYYEEVDRAVENVFKSSPNIIPLTNNQEEASELFSSFERKIICDNNSKNTCAPLKFKKSRNARNVASPKFQNMNTATFLSRNRLRKICTRTNKLL